VGGGVAWAASGKENPEHSVQRLLHRGWSETNPAYGWLATLKASSCCGPINAFTTDLAGIVAESQIEWLFRAAVRTRRHSAQRFPVSVRNAALGANKPRNIGPYPFGQRPPAFCKDVEPRDIAEAFSVHLGPTNNVIDAQVLAQLQERRRLKKTVNEERT
jgi:hypothetical protein